MYDLCIVGAGASGMSAAVTAGRRGKKVLLLDRNNKTGKKIYATGNGRCNITNNYMDYAKCYNSSDESYTDFLSDIMGESPDRSVVDFLSSIGIKTYTNPEGYVYPHSMQASSVVWALLDEMKKNHITVCQGEDVHEIKKQGGNFIIYTDKKYEAKKVLLCTGGRSYSKLGGAESGYILAERLGHSICDIRPSLCGLCVEEELDLVDGVRSYCRVSLTDENGNIIKSEKGEIQFTKSGISGIVIFNLSSKAGKLLKENKKIYVSVDLLGDMPEIAQKVAIDSFGDRSIPAYLNGFINDKLAHYILNKNSIDKNKSVNRVPISVLDKITGELKNLRFHITDLYDFEKAQVTAGGVNICEINSKTMESNIIDNLYFAGEILDIDGICGGYNLSFAIMTGIIAGNSI